MKPKEANLLFCSVVLLLLLVLAGVSQVDASLTSLLLPAAPYTTLALAYQHGFVLKGPQCEYSLPSIKLATLDFTGENLLFTLGNTGFCLPRYIALGNIEKLKRLLAVDKLTP